MHNPPNLWELRSSYYQIRKSRFMSDYFDEENVGVVNVVSPPMTPSASSTEEGPLQKENNDDEFKTYSPFQIDLKEGIPLISQWRKSSCPTFTKISRTNEGFFDLVPSESFVNETQDSINEQQQQHQHHHQHLNNNSLISNDHLKENRLIVFVHGLMGN